MYENDAAEPIRVGNYTCRVVYDPDPTPPWDWDWGATVLDEDGRDFAGRRDLPWSWRDYHGDVESAIRASHHPLAIRRASTRSGPRWVFVTAEDVELTGCPMDRLPEYVAGAVQEFEQWAEGDVYGFVVEDEHGDHVDSCWGFYGDTGYPMDEAVEIAQSLAADAAEEVRRSYLTAYDRAVALVAS